MLTVWSFSGFGIECACCLNTIVLLYLSRITTNDLMLFCKAGSNSEFVESCLAPDVLLPNPSTLDEITFAFLYISAVGMVKMSLPSQDLSVGVSPRMGKNAGC